MQTAGIILDLYDDSEGRILKEIIGDREMPPKLAALELMETAEQEKLPNRLFALVAQNGDEVLRKYATHDEGHLTASIIYFMKCGHLLPEEAQTAAACNLVEACGWYGVDPPEQIVKIALAEKTADLNNTEMMPASSLSTGEPKRTNTAKTISTKSKTAAGRFAEISGPGAWRGPVDVTGKNSPQIVKHASYNHHCLPGRYPIDSLEQVKTAQEYFEVNWGSFTGSDRHSYATTLQERASDLGLGDLGGMIRQYAGNEYGTKIAGELMSRIRNFDGMDHQAVYEVLLEKTASTPPGVLAEMLEQADEATGVSEAWNRFNGFLDPYRAVFAKTADDVTPENGVDGKQWSWNLGASYVNDTMLKDLAQNGGDKLEIAFSYEFARDFEKDPIGIFDSLPDPQKHALARLASDNSRGSYRKT
jgi:hypothetical protein